MKSSLLSFLLIISVSFFTCNIVSAQKQKISKIEAGIQFIENDWEQALKTAKDQNKLVDDKNNKEYKNFLTNKKAKKI